MRTPTNPRFYEESHGILESAGYLSLPFVLISRKTHFAKTQHIVLFIYPLSFLMILHPLRVHLYAFCCADHETIAFAGGSI
jgi:hypothetical protein